MGLFLGQKGDLAVCAVRWHFGWLFHGIVKLLVQKAPLSRRDGGAVSLLTEGELTAVEITERA